MESRWLDPNKVSVHGERQVVEIRHREMNYGKKFGVLPKMFSKEGRREEKQKATEEKKYSMCVNEIFGVPQGFHSSLCEAPDCSAAVGFTQIYSAKLQPLNAFLHFTFEQIWRSHRL